MKDTEALRLLDKEIKSVKALSDPPSNSGDVKRLDAYIQKTTSAVNSAADTVQNISKYGKAIMEKLDTLRLELERTTINLQEHVRKVLSNLQTTNTLGEQGSHTPGTQTKGVGYTVVTPMKGNRVSLGEGKQTSRGSQKKSANDDSKEILEYAQKLQELERKKQKIEESILQTQIMIDKLRKGGGITLEDVEKLMGVVEDWLEAKKQHLMKETAKDDQEQERTDHKKEGKMNKKDLQHKEQERLSEEKEVIENVKRDEERKREEEERKLKEEQRMLKQKEEEEIEKKKEEERLRNVQEKKRMEKEEQNRKKEQEARKREEDERKRIEEERLRKEKEEEEKKKNPANWNNIEYKRLDSGSGSYDQGVRCQVYAMKDTLEEDDLECNGNDEWRGDDLPLLALGERPASSVVHVQAKSGQLTSSVPMHVSIPYNSVLVSSDEAVLRVSVDGGPWEEREDVATVKPKASSEDLCMKGINLCQFKTIKLVVIAKPRSQNVEVDTFGTSEQSSVDNRVTLIIPENTFDESTTVKLVVVPVEDDSLSVAKGFYEHCQNIQSTSSIIRIECKRRTKNEMNVCLRRHKQDDRKPKFQTGKMCHVFKGRDGQWKVPQVTMNTKDSTVSITLPRGEDQYVVLELEFSRDTPKEHFVQTASEICYHAHAMIVRVIAKQKAEDPSMLMIQCMSSRKVSSRLDELKKMGYTLGPDVSKEFPMQNGQKINLRGSGNISLSTGSSQQIQLTFNGYMDTAKLETTINVVDKYGQLDMLRYTGQLYFSVPEENIGQIKFVGTDGTLPLTLPKTDMQLPHNLAAMVKFLAFRLTENKRKDWKNVLLNLGLQDEVDKIEKRPVKVDSKPDDDRYICEIVLRDWMRSRALNEDKVQPIMSSLVKNNRAELKDESSKFIDIYNTFLSDEQLSKMASIVSDDWIMLALYLGFSDEDINSCKCLGEKNPAEEAFRMFCKWRVSERVAQSGSNVIKNLLSTLDSLTKFNQLKYYIKGLISKK